MLPQNSSALPTSVSLPQVRRSRSNAGAAVALTILLLASASAAQAQQYNGTVFGPNVYVFSPSVPESAIEAQMTKLANEPQFSTNRYAVLFQPGAYTVKAPVGFYESVSGLGQVPAGTSITGFLTPNTDPNFQANLTDYFWRSLENMSITTAPNPQQGVQDNTFLWGVSQGAPLRRMQFSGPLQLTNEYCGWTSGGFISDTSIAGNLNFCSQQQWFTRNSSIGGKPLYGNWNMVFAGVTGAPATSFPTPAYTTLPKTPVSREKPFLYMDGNGNYRVFVPASQTGSAGTSWSSTSMGPGTSQPIANFFIAQPNDSAAAINTALAGGLNLILTPGIYPLSQPLVVTNPNTVILGMGYADLVPQAGTAAIQVADVDGVQIAGLMIDAGPVNSPVLLQLGTPGAPRTSHHANPTAVDDLFLRIGGPTPGVATTSIQVDSDDVILDDIWAWRADHGPDNPPAGAPPTFGWTVNTAAHGLVVNGDNVTAMGLAVEHYQQEQVLWNGDNGQTIFFQSELPYDVPNQAAWMDGASDGYPAYVVAPNVLQHQGYGLGVYSNFTAAPVVASSAITVPDTPGVTITDAVTVFLNSLGSISHIVNGAGDPVQGPNTTISDLKSYGGQPCTTNCGGTPAIPASLTATAGASGQVNLAWTDATPGVYYTIYRGQTGGVTPSAGVQVATSLSAPNFADTGLGSQHHLLLRRYRQQRRRHLRTVRTGLGHHGRYRCLHHRAANAPDHPRPANHRHAERRHLGCCRFLSDLPRHLQHPAQPDRHRHTNFRQPGRRKRQPHLIQRSQPHRTRGLLLQHPGGRRRRHLRPQSLGARPLPHQLDTGLGRRLQRQRQHRHRPHQMDSAGRRQHRPESLRRRHHHVHHL